MRRFSPHRRRLTIAALVLLMLGGGLWWSTRPKIDPRLVGTWKHPGDKILNLHTRFDADGRGVFFSDIGPQPLLVTRFRWWVEDGVVVECNDVKPGAWGALGDFAVDAWQRVSGQMSSRYIRKRIAEVSEHRIVLRFTRHTEPHELDLLERVTDGRFDNAVFKVH